MEENIKERKAFLLLQLKVLELEERIEKLEGNQSDKKRYALDGVTELEFISSQETKQ